VAAQDLERWPGRSEPQVHSIGDIAVPLYHRPLAEAPGTLDSTFDVGGVRHQMRRLWPFGRSVSREPVTPTPRALDPLKLPDDLPPEIAAFIRGPIDGRVDWFDAFLSESELDDLRTHKSAADLTPQEVRRVREIVASGQPRQARFNLLLNPRLLPDDVRLGALRAALTDSDPYMRIAATVGLQDPAAAVIAPPDWPTVRDALIGCLDDPEPAIRNRTSVTLAGRAVPGDGPALRAALVHDEQVRNVLIACIRAEAEDVVLALLPRLLAQERMQADSRTYLERWQADGRRPPDDPPAVLMLPGLGYIPNLDC
jgi:hypothetical protein